MAFVGRDFHWGGLWRVEIEGLNVGEFQEVTLPSVEVSVIEYNHGGRKNAFKRPGPIKYSNLKLKRGYSNNRVLQEWWENIAKGVMDRRSISMVQVDEEAKETMRWNMFETWICKWTQSPQKASDNQISTEEVEICLEYMERAG